MFPHVRSLFVAAAPVDTAPVATVPPALPEPNSSASTISDVFSTVADNLGKNGYQTGVALVVM
ncbi:MAG TPA: hypothetical protein VMM60_12575, partial [Ilumatobacter sp.]|nr:hypothetical protein [Ilumatobacter sp.]